MEGVFSTLFLLCQAPLEAANRLGWKTGLLTLAAQAAQLVWLLLSPATQLWAIDTSSPCVVEAPGNAPSSACCSLSVQCARLACARLRGLTAPLLLPHTWTGRTCTRAGCCSGCQ